MSFNWNYWPNIPLFIHSSHFYSAPSSPLLLRGAPDYSTDTVSEFHVDAHRQQQVKDLPKVPTWRIERESNLRPPGWKSSSQPRRHHVPQIMGATRVSMPASMVEVRISLWHWTCRLRYSYKLANHREAMAVREGKPGHGPIQFGCRLWLSRQRRNKREILGNMLNWSLP